MLIYSAWEALLQETLNFAKEHDMLCDLSVEGPRKEREDVTKVEKKMNVWMARNAVRWRLSLL